MPGIKKKIISKFDGKVKSSSSRGREFRGTRSTYVRRSEHGMKRNPETGPFYQAVKVGEKPWAIKNPPSARFVHAAVVF